MTPTTGLRIDRADGLPALDECAILDEARRQAPASPVRTGPGTPGPRRGP